MLKGIIVDNAEKDAEKIKDKLQRRFPEVEFSIKESSNGTIEMIDTRHADLVLFVKNDLLSENTAIYIEKFVRRMLDSDKRAVSLKIDNKIRYIVKERILFLEVMGRNSYVHTSRNKYVLCRQNLGSVLKHINDPYFIRCHKSFAVNVRNIGDICRERRGVWKPMFRQKADTECLISETYYKEVMQIYEEWLEKEEIGNPDIINSKYPQLGNQML